MGFICFLFVAGSICMTIFMSSEVRANQLKPRDVKRALRATKVSHKPRIKKPCPHGSDPVWK